MQGKCTHTRKLDLILSILKLTDYNEVIQDYSSLSTLRYQKKTYKYRSKVKVSKNMKNTFHLVSFDLG
jgi:hypothetical protein